VLVPEVEARETKILFAPPPEFLHGKRAGLRIFSVCQYSNLSPSISLAVGTSLEMQNSPVGNFDAITQLIEVTIFSDSLGS
jgi:hypothetical protein